MTRSANVPESPLVEKEMDAVRDRHLKRKIQTTRETTGSTRIILGELFGNEQAALTTCKP